MATLILTLLLSVGLQGYALTANHEVSPDTIENGDVCKDCTQIFEGIEDLLSNSDLQKKIMAGIDSLCAHLPEPAAKLCKEEVDKMLPLAITFVTGMAKPADICKMIGLCSSSDQQEKMLSYFVTEALQAAVKSENGKPESTCSFCIFLVKTLEDLLPKERTEDAVIKLLDEICHILPSSYRGQCEAIIDKFTKPVLDAIISYATPEAICALIHLCKGQEALVVDPCTLPLYRCRDIRTALTCGTLFYCQKFTLKPLSNNLI
ncbi:surfactant protein Ba [Austrofundulus limnaeus]|uniref:Surfactant protein Ba n=1 Tax=Austrofundulus limnaeus TaxID=52670 RepID=A0A2I4AUU8_AUSLI|nr:PREDICTED: prosaposin-like [Austrofundulus limnaeus]